MTDHAMSSTHEGVTIHLLDSALGHSLQSWSFFDLHEISIGRADGNDVVISDPHVSRLHAKLVWQGRSWTLVSVGKHGTLVNDRVVAETQMDDATRFRLGASGPTLRFEHGVAERRHSETVDSVHPELIEMLEIDRMRQQAEANEIAGNSLFQELQEHVRRTRGAVSADPSKIDQAVDQGGK
jgi:pSer/pThr/pTyr-binding forkhead associated (FHA) protein